jgi:hypothetical protein
MDHNVVSLGVCSGGFKGVATNQRACALRFVLWQGALVLFNLAVTQPRDSKKHKLLLKNALALGDLAEKNKTGTIDPQLNPPPTLYAFVDLVGLILQCTFYQECIRKGRDVSTLFPHILQMEIHMLHICQGIPPPGWKAQITVIQKWMQKELARLLMHRLVMSAHLAKFEKETAEKYVDVYMDVCV